MLLVSHTSSCVDIFYCTDWTRLDIHHWLLTGIAASAFTTLDIWTLGYFRCSWSDQVVSIVYKLFSTPKVLTTSWEILVSLSWRSIDILYPKPLQASYLVRLCMFTTLLVSWRYAIAFGTWCTVVLLGLRPWWRLQWYTRKKPVGNTWLVGTVPKHDTQHFELWG